MSVAIVLFPILLIIAIIIVLFPILIGIYVYRDAKSRGMDAVLWTLIAIILPSFIGLIIYLIMRNDHILLSCPKCGGEVQEHFATCPSCGQKLKSSCSNCGTALNPAWRICPQCGKEITDTAEFTPPVINKGKNNNSLVGVIIAIIAIPILIIVIAVFGLVFSFTTKNVLDVNYDDVNYDVDIESISTEPFNVMTVLDADLEDEYIKWINETKNKEEGIYSISYDIEESGGISPADGSYDYYATYELTYKYVILVVNPPEGKAYNLDDLEYNTMEGSTIAQNPTIMLKEVDKASGDEFDNVFVIKLLAKYNIDTPNDSEEFEHLGQVLTVNITNSNSSFYYEVKMNPYEEYSAISNSTENTENTENSEETEE